MYTSSTKATVTTGDQIKNSQDFISMGTHLKRNGSKEMPKLTLRFSTREKRRNLLSCQMSNANKNCWNESSSKSVRANLWLTRTNTKTANCKFVNKRGWNGDRSQARSRGCSAQRYSSLKKKPVFAVSPNVQLQFFAHRIVNSQNWRTWWKLSLCVSWESFVGLEGKSEPWCAF